MKYPWLFVGAKVVAVRFEENDFPDMPPSFERGEILTVRHVAEYGPYIGIKLVGIVGCTHPFFGSDCPWAADAFRPVSTIDTTGQVTAMRELMQTAVKTQKVDA